MRILSWLKRGTSFSLVLNAAASVVMLAIFLSGCAKEDTPAVTYTLTVSTTPSEAGTVEISPAPTNGAYKEGTKVSLTVKTNAGNSFRQWSGDATGTETTIAIVMDGNKSVEAVFNKLYTLNVNQIPADGGTVEVSPKAENGTYVEGTKVTLTATAAVGFMFKEWSGDAVDAKSTMEITMDGNKSIAANFEVGFTENFDSNTANNFIDDNSGLWSVANNAYVVKGNGGDTFRYSYYNKTFDNFEYSVDIKATDNTSVNNAVGIFFRVPYKNYEQDGYMFAITQNGFWYFVKQNSETITWLQSWTTSPSLNNGLDQVNNLKVVCSGSTIEVFINDVSHGVFTDADFSSGYVGMMGYDGENCTNSFVFDNIKLKGIATQKSTVVPAASRPKDAVGMDIRFSR